MKIDVSIESARGIYEFVKDHNDFMGKFQQQIIPVIELPRFIREKLPTATCLCMEEKNADEGCEICLLVHSSHSKSSQRALCHQLTLSYNHIVPRCRVDFINADRG